MRKIFFFVGLFVAMASCSEGITPATLIAPGPSDPGGPGSELVGSRISTGAGQGTGTLTFTVTGTGGMDTGPSCGANFTNCSDNEDCCSETCIENVCLTCGDPGAGCDETLPCCRRLLRRGRHLLRERGLGVQRQQRLLLRRLVLHRRHVHALSAGRPATA